MEITIGIQNTPRELTLEVSLSSKEISDAVAESVTKQAPLTLTDDKGRTIVVPAGALAFVEIGAEEQRRVGFGAL